MELLLYFIVAIFVFLKLYSVVGKENNEIKTDARVKKYVNTIVRDIELDEDEVNDFKIKDTKEKEEKILNTLDLHLKNKIQKLSMIDNSFNIYDFIQGVENAFELVLIAYEEGDEEFLKKIMSKETFEKINKVFKKNSKKELLAKNILVKLRDICITKIEYSKDLAFITTKISSEQIKYVEDKNGNIVSGNKSKAGIVNDCWIFMKSLKSKNKNWKIVNV